MYCNYLVGNPVLHPIRDGQFVLFTLHGRTNTDSDLSIAQGHLKVNWLRYKVFYDVSAKKSQETTQTLKCLTIQIVY